MALPTSCTQLSMAARNTGFGEDIAFCMLPQVSGGFGKENAFGALEQTIVN